jgi:hypothetical protein
MEKNGNECCHSFPSMNPSVCFFVDSEWKTLEKVGRFYGKDWQKDCQNFSPLGTPATFPKHSMGPP